jgi:predicted DsbA family dithiol-disulfide isomerase
VPFFVIDRAHGLAGAQHPDVILDVLRQVWTDRRPEPTPSAAGDGACEGDACPV